MRLRQVMPEHVTDSSSTLVRRIARRHDKRVTTRQPFVTDGMDVTSVTRRADYAIDVQPASRIISFVE